MRDWCLCNIKSSHPGIRCCRCHGNSWPLPHQFSFLSSLENPSTQLSLSSTLEGWNSDSGGEAGLLAGLRTSSLRILGPNFIILFFFLIIFLNLFLAALGLHCCMRAFSSCSKQGLPSLRCAGFSLQWLLFCGAQALGVLWHEGSVVVARGL